jgi:hypothetical protein
VAGAGARRDAGADRVEPPAAPLGGQAVEVRLARGGERRQIVAVARDVAKTVQHEQQDPESVRCA